MDFGSQEPRRLLKRYFKDLTVFGWKILPQLWQLQLRSHKRSKSAEASSPHSMFDVRRSTFDVPKVHGEAALKIQANTDWQFLKLPEHFDLTAVRNDALLDNQTLADGRHCLLEMSNVKFIDSTGVGLLIRLQKKIRATGRQLVLLAPSPKVQRALVLMQLQDFSPPRRTSPRPRHSSPRAPAKNLAPCACALPPPLIPCSGKWRNHRLQRHGSLEHHRDAPHLPATERAGH